MNEKLELRDISGYLPYGLKIRETSGEIKQIKGYNTACNAMIFMYWNNKIQGQTFDIDCKPILRPPSSLYKEITNNGSEPFIPIVELAKIGCLVTAKWEVIGEEAISDSKHVFWYSNKNKCFLSTRDSVHNQYQLFDKLHEWKIDYRGLIERKLAIDANTLENNPYK